MTASDFSARSLTHVCNVSVAEKPCHRLDLASVTVCQRLFVLPLAVSLRRSDDDIRTVGKSGHLRRVRHLQNLDLLTAASKQRTIEKCRLTYGSEITIIIGFCCGRRSLDQIFPSLPLDPRGRRRLGRHRLSSLVGYAARKEFFRLSAFVFSFARVFAHRWFSWPLLFSALDRR
jgi:hypothetical protein